MVDKEGQSLGEFGASFKGFLDQMAAQAPAQEPIFLTRLRAHFSAEPTAFPIVAEQFEPSDHPNVQRALESYVAERNCSTELMGITGDQMFAYGGLGLAQLIKTGPSGLWGGGPSATPGPVQYLNIALEDDQIIACVQCGLYLIAEGERRLAVLISRPSEMGFSRKVKTEVMAADRSHAEAFLAELRTLIRKRNVYRSRVLSLSIQRDETKVQFHRLPVIAADQIILPGGLLDRIERQTIGFGKHSSRLAAMGRHLKRGLLLYGPPGTGKTLTAMYLASQMRERTVLLLTGRGMGLIEQSCAMARLLQPSIVVLEDVDLIAEERTREGACAAVLFELLNQMDGLADDADILFLLTTNRPDILEPALAARPGRIDQAIEIPLPDADCRRRLFELYSRGLTFQLDRLDQFVTNTEGASAAFIRELLRKAALFAADELTGSPVVMDRHVDEALHELVVAGGPITKSLLGVR